MPQQRMGHDSLRWPFERQPFAQPVADERLRLRDEWLRYLPFEAVARLTVGAVRDTIPASNGDVFLVQHGMTRVPAELCRRTKDYENSATLTLCCALSRPALFTQASGFAMTLDDLFAQGLLRISTAPRMLPGDGQDCDQVHLYANAGVQGTRQGVEQPDPFGRDAGGRGQNSDRGAQIANPSGERVQISTGAGGSDQIALQLRTDFGDAVGVDVRTVKWRMLKTLNEIQDFIHGVVRDLFCSCDLFIHTWLLSTQEPLTWNDWGRETPSLVAYPAGRRRQCALMRHWLRYLPARDVLEMSEVDLLLALVHPNGLASIGRGRVSVTRFLVAATLQYHRDERARIKRVADSLYVFVSPTGRKAL